MHYVNKLILSLLGALSNLSKKKKKSFSIELSLHFDTTLFLTVFSLNKAVATARILKQAT